MSSKNPTVGAMEKNRVDNLRRIKAMYVKAEQTCNEIMQEKVEAHAALLDEIEEYERMICEEHVDMAILTVKLQVAKNIIKTITRDMKDLQELIDGHSHAVHETSAAARAAVQEVEEIKLPVRQPRIRQRREFETFEEFEASIDQTTQPGTAGGGAAAATPVAVKVEPNVDDDDDKSFADLLAEATPQKVPSKTPPRPKPKFKIPPSLKVIDSDVKPPPLSTQ